MDNKEYLEKSARTVSDNYSEISTRMVSENKVIDLQHAAMGMVTESAEFMDALKKSIFYGKKLDTVNLKEEVGDLLWYAALALRALDVDFDSVMDRNIEKLKARYPQKFTEEKAVVRDLEVERKILEKE